MTCVDAFKNLNIVARNNTLAISPCCISPVTSIANLDFKNDSYLTKIRTSWLSEQFPQPCSACKFAEKQNLPSRRINTNRWYTDNNYNTDVELVKIDYWVGDLCNLRCAICGPNDSSAWKEELKLPKELKQSTVNHFWKTLDLSTIRFIHFTGGEPLLNKEHLDFLQDLPNKKLVTINYNTNGTIKPNNDLLTLWKEFQLVILDFSIDDIEERYEYQRYPAKWLDVTKNLNWFINNTPTNCMFAVNTSVGILNYSNLDMLNSWLANNFYKNRVGDPIEHRQQQVNGLFACDTASSYHTKIVKFLDDCDARRGTDWRSVFPELIKSI
jgi:sulfatase maturation enzyme AslB (radical SAM superfamily)